MQNTYKAAAWNEQGSFDLIDRDLPDPGPGWVNLRVAAAGICGSDVHAYRGTLSSVAGHTPGHELSGTVAAVGEGVDVPVGAGVIVDPVISCGDCPHCLRGNPWHCARRSFVGGDLLGAFSEYVTLPATALHDLPRGVTLKEGAMAEPLAVSLHGVAQARVKAGDRVIILGGGTIGLFALLAARDAGATEIYITARHPAQADLARALGATGVFPDGYSATMQLDHMPIDVVIEAAGGTASTVVEAVRFARPGGTVAIMGLFEGTPRLPALQVVVKELTIIGAIAHGQTGGRSDFGTAVDLLASHIEELRPMLTHEFPLTQINSAFDTASDKTTGSIKVVVTP